MFDGIFANLRLSRSSAGRGRRYQGIRDRLFFAGALRTGAARFGRSCAAPCFSPVTRIIPSAKSILTLFTSIASGKLTDRKRRGEVAQVDRPMSHRAGGCIPI
jgi:hypothetical protein